MVDRQRNVWLVRKLADWLMDGRMVGWDMTDWFWAKSG